MSRLDVVVRIPGQVPVIREISDDDYWEIICGCFDVGYPFPWYDANLLVLVGDESLLDGSAFNFSTPVQQFCGPAIFVRRDGADFVSLTERDLVLLSSFFGAMKDDRRKRRC